MAKLPWLSGRPSSSDVESASLLYSIYGSQVSQVLLASSDVDLHHQDENWVELIHPSSKSIVRPKSSPAVRLQRQNNSQPTADAVRLRPATAHFRNQSAIRRDDGGRAAQRPRSALTRHHPSALHLEDVEDQQVLSSLAIHQSKPVTLTRIPEYVNFWQGKPLSEREQIVHSHPRKGWRRPKSDYGSKFAGFRSESSKKAILDNKDLENTDNQSILDSSVNCVNSNKTKRQGLSSDFALHDLMKRKTKNSTSSIRDGENDGGDEKDNNTRYTDTASRGNTKTNIWAQRSHHPKRRSSTASSSVDSDIDSSQNENLQDFLLCVTGSSSTSTRFELPMDTRQLEGMSPLKYLQSHCIISDHHMLLCSQVFTKHDKVKKGFLCHKELRGALQDAAHGCLSESQIDSLLQLVHYHPDITADRQLFAALCCLASRMFSFYLLPLMAGKEVIEIVDFEALDWKLRGCSIGHDLQNLFKQI